MRMRLPRWVSEMTICRSGSKNAMFPPMTRLRVKPNLMLISLVVRRAVQVGWFVGKVEAGLFGDWTVNLLDTRALGSPNQLRALVPW